MARRLNKPVAVLCTSGTAGTHFQAAAFEAHESGVPLILITADRPASVRGLGANQTIEQPGLYANAVRSSKRTYTFINSLACKSAIDSGAFLEPGAITTFCTPCLINDLTMT